MIPYIKNKHFNEEKEFRLIFDLGDLLKNDAEWVRNEKNVYLDVDGVKKPNLRVEFGNALERKNEKIILYYRNELCTEGLKQFQEEMQKAKPKSINIELRFVDEEALKKNEILIS